MIWHSAKTDDMDSATHAYTKVSLEQLREQLILDNLIYVRKILSTLTVGLPPHYDKENLEQAGIVGLVETARTFDPNRGVAFRTYCYPRIRGAIVDEMRKNSPVPQQMLALISQVKAAYTTRVTRLARNAGGGNRAVHRQNSAGLGGNAVCDTAKMERPVL